MRITKVILLSLFALLDLFSFSPVTQVVAFASARRSGQVLEIRFAKGLLTVDAEGVRQWK